MTTPKIALFTNITYVNRLFFALILSLSICSGCGESGEKGAAGTNRVESASLTAPTNTAKAVATVTNKVEATHVWDWTFGRGKVTFKCDKEFDANKLLDSLTITPKPKSLSVQVNQTWHSGDLCYYIILTADFDFKTTYTLKIHKGAAFVKGGVLEKEITKTFELENLPSELSFATSGRYLPPSGLKAIGVKTKNVAELLCYIRRVPEQNVIQLLARENGVYKYGYSAVSYASKLFWPADGKETESLAINSETFSVPVKRIENKDVTTPIPIRVGNQGSVSNGIYLVAVKRKKTIFHEPNRSYYSQISEENKNGIFHYADKYRLVCVTDIGLSVRQDGEGNLLVWTTSLTKGEPLTNITVSVYESNNTILATGTTDSNGIIRFAKQHNHEPFAIVATKKDGSDICFLALTNTSYHETNAERPEYLTDDACEAFMWTERGIYRHNEPILLHLILRNGKGVAPKAFPVELVLSDPEDRAYLKTTVMSDSLGTANYPLFSVDDSQPSGKWTIVAKIPGKDGNLLGRVQVKIEDFVPPQIRTSVKFKDDATLTNLGFTVSAENLYGGPAVDLVAKAYVLLSDAPFEPANWKGWRFGDCSRSVEQEQQLVECTTKLDKKGEAHGVWSPRVRRKPAAAIYAGIQGMAIERGGRKVSTWGKRKLLHYYPYYIGVKFPKVITAGATCDVASVLPNGTAATNVTRELKVRITKLDYVYGYTRNHHGDYIWESNIVRFPVDFEVEKVTLGANGQSNLKLFTAGAGAYELWIYDEKSDVSFRQTYEVTDGATDNEIHSSLSNPTQLSLTGDKKAYLPGEKPRLTVKSPFTGTACLSIFRDKHFTTRVFALTNHVQTVELDPVTEAFAPSVDVVLNIVQAVQPGKSHLANRANGLITLRVDRLASRLGVDVKADVTCHRTGGSRVRATVKVKGAETNAKTRAVVTVVDEAINILTQQETPRPFDWLGRPRRSVHRPYDVYSSLLPVMDDEKLARTGLKTGGGLATMMMNRFSPVPNRRFKPLSLWQTDVPVTNGVAVVDFNLSEFAGEVRVTAVAYTAKGTGSKSVQAKVAPNLIMQPDAPRFAAPGDVLLATLTVANRTDQPGVVKYEVLATDGLSVTNNSVGEMTLQKEETKTLEIPVKVGEMIGEGHLTFRTDGLGELHTSVINLPVRPASTWEQKATTVLLKPGEKKVFSAGDVYLPHLMKRHVMCGDSGLTELAQAMRYLVDYPYGCLEQTTSQVFPLIYAGGILNRISLDAKAREDATNAVTFVEIGIRKIFSMVRANDFAMWADVNYAPWERSYSLWAAHFLVEARKAGYTVEGAYYEKVKGFLNNWVMSKKSEESVYAALILALADQKDLARQLYWFDQKEKLSALEKFQLARAFVATGDKVRAAELLKGTKVPTDIRGKAFALLAYLDYNPEDPRILKIVKELLAMRNPTEGHWLTTRDNAHALLALGAFYQNQLREAPNTKPHVVVVQKGKETSLKVNHGQTFVGGDDLTVVNKGAGTGFLSLAQLSLSNPAKDEVVSDGIKIVRTYRTRNGNLTSLNQLKRGDLITVTLEIHSNTTNGVSYTDLVIEDLLPACLEADSDIPRGGSNKYELRRDVRDDRVVIFTLPFALPYDERVYVYPNWIKNSVHFLEFSYNATVVSSGEFIAPGASVEAMYDPELRATTASEKVTIAE